MVKRGMPIAVIWVFLLLVVSGGTASDGTVWETAISPGERGESENVETIRGEVVGLATFTPVEDLSPGIRLLVRTEEETISVHLGPYWALENRDIGIEIKDQVEITGSRIIFQGEPAMIAREVMIWRYLEDRLPSRE